MFSNLPKLYMIRQRTANDIPIEMTSDVTCAVELEAKL
jgi:hypothetical protein